MLISVAMAAYNGEKFIREQIDSILRQTYQNFELVICDDCSSDSTPDIIRDYAQKDKRIHCFINEVNLGFNKNFEKAVKLCKGEYIAFSDQDDIWTKDHLETLLALLIAGDKQLSCGNSAFIDEYGRSLGKTISDYLGDTGLLTDDYMKLQSTLYGRSRWQGAAMLLHKSLLQVGLPLPYGIYSYDVWFFLLACVSGTFIYTEKIVNNYRQHSRNTSGNVKLSLVKLIGTIIKNRIYNRNDIPERLYHCNELLKRLPDMKPAMQGLIHEAKCYYENKKYFSYRIQNIHFWILHFKYMNGGLQKPYFFIRLIKHLFFGTMLFVCNTPPPPAVI